LSVSDLGRGKSMSMISRTRPDRAETGLVRLGGIGAATAHPVRPDLPLAGGPQMVEVSRDGRRIYLKNWLYGAWDDQF